MFLRCYLPGRYLSDVFTIDYKQLYDEGFRGLIFDIDNTLVPHGTDVTEEIERLFNSIHKLGFKTLLLSNNSKSRVESFNRNIQTLYINSACKPQKESFDKGVELLGISPDKIIVIGDSVFSDILGANKAGLNSILVKYIGHEKKEWKGYKRFLEKIILILYKPRF